MTEPGRELRRLDRRVSELEGRTRRSAGLHGLYAAVGLLVGLGLPLAQVSPGGDEVPDRYSAPGLAFSILGEHELDHPVHVVMVGLAVAITTLSAAVAFIVAAWVGERAAATVALVASGLLPAVLIVANGVFGVTEVDTGSSDDTLQGWTVGFWVLLLAGFAGCWIGTFLRDQLDR